MVILLRNKKGKISKQNVKYLDTNRENIFDTSTAYVYGNKDAKDSIVIFYDYRCGYCHKATTVLGIFAEKNKRIVQQTNQLYASTVSVQISRYYGSSAC